MRSFTSFLPPLSSGVFLHAKKPPAEPMAVIAGEGLFPPFNIHWLKKGRFFPGYKKFFEKVLEALFLRLGSLRAFGQRIDKRFILLRNPVDAFTHSAGRFIIHNVGDFLQCPSFHPQI